MSKPPTSPPTGPPTSPIRGQPSASPGKGDSDYKTPEIKARKR